MASSGKRKTVPPQISKEEYLEVNKDEPWLHSLVGKALYDEEYYRIIDFYVLHSPCKVSSYSPRTLESLGWKNPWKSKTFRDTFDMVPGFREGENFRFHESKNHFLEMWNDYGLKDFFSSEEEFAIYIYAGESNPRMDLLHHIRNAFAHGRFSCKKINREYYFYFEDVTEIKRLTGLFVTARICLKKTTLSEWLAIFEKRSDVAREMYSTLS